MHFFGGGGGSICVYNFSIEITSQKELANAQGVPQFLFLCTLKLQEGAAC